MRELTKIKDGERLITPVLDRGDLPELLVMHDLSCNHHSCNIACCARLTVTHTAFRSVTAFDHDAIMTSSNVIA